MGVATTELAISGMLFFRHSNIGIHRHMQGLCANLKLVTQT